ncbi:response regulator transcription factor [Pseudomonas sp. Marseille-Q5117]|uniref:response regulator transcription factor n=1 Tax=Pseudomonas sp. Marseille-Q5117 TaxID=2972777 RepID=UPI0021C70DAB|nr:helix-turn-helix transcriptional regulator [Pseudomonas sp. Marseille-Q5117]
MNIKMKPTAQNQEIDRALGQNLANQAIEIRSEQHKVNTAISAIYRAALSGSAHYQQELHAIIGSCFNFDSSWKFRTSDRKKWSVNYSNLFNLPTSFMRDWEVDDIPGIDVLAKISHDSVGNAVALSLPEVDGPKKYIQWCQSRGLSSMMTIEIEDEMEGGVFNLSFYRARPESFSTKDLLKLELLAPHIAASIEINKQAKFTQLSRERSGIAVADRTGKIRDVDKRFTDYLESRYAWTSNCLLPSPLLVDAENLIGGAASENIEEFTIIPVDGFYFLFLQSNSLVSELSPRELQIAKLYQSGQAHKLIAKSLGISPETVKHHLKSIYRKLGVTSRSQAVEQIRDGIANCVYR